VKRTLFAAGLLAASTGLAAAHDTTPIEREMRRQAQSIEDGRRIGHLTWLEVRQLNDEQSRISWMLTQARYDGNVTRREFDAICDAQELAKSNIAYQVADDQSSHWRRWFSGRDDQGRDTYGNGWGQRNSSSGWGGYGRWGWGYGRRNSDTY
jgi:hypothetical protein